jgi:hypothetical protein
MGIRYVSIYQHATLRLNLGSIPRLRFIIWTLHIEQSLERLEGVTRSVGVAGHSFKSTPTDEFNASSKTGRCLQPTVSFSVTAENSLSFPFRFFVYGKLSFPAQSKECIFGRSRNYICHTEKCPTEMPPSHSTVPPVHDLYINMVAEDGLVTARPDIITDDSTVPLSPAFPCPPRRSKDRSAAPDRIKSTTQTTQFFYIRLFTIYILHRHIVTASRHFVAYRHITYISRSYNSVYPISSQSISDLSQSLTLTHTHIYTHTKLRPLANDPT